MRKSPAESKNSQDRPIRLSGNELQQESRRRGEDFGDLSKEFRIFAAGPLTEAAFLYCVSHRPIGIASDSKSETDLMNAQPALHPTDQTLHLLRPGQARRRLGRIGQQTPRVLPRLPKSRRRDVLRQLPGQTPRRPGPAPVHRTRGLLARRHVDDRRRREPGGTAPGQHLASGTGRPPRLSDPPRARPRRDGRRLPRREHADGPQGSAQGRRQPPDQPTRRPRSLPPRDPLGRQAAPPQHRRRLFGLPAGREPRLDHGVRRGARPGADGQGQGAVAGRQCLQLTSIRRRWACSTPTTAGWSTATSSRPI